VGSHPAVRIQEIYFAPNRHPTIQKLVTQVTKFKETFVTLKGISGLQPQKMANAKQNSDKNATPEHNIKTAAAGRSISDPNEPTQPKLLANEQQQKYTKHERNGDAHLGPGPNASIAGERGARGSARRSARRSARCINYPTQF